MLAHEEYEDVTPRVIKSICEKDEDIADILVARSSIKADLRMLGRVAIHLDCYEVQQALERRYGEEWREVCERAEAHQ